MTAIERREYVRRLRLLERNLAADPLTRLNAQLAADSLEEGLLGRLTLSYVIGAGIAAWALLIAIVGVGAWVIS